MHVKDKVAESEVAQFKSHTQRVTRHVSKHEHVRTCYMYMYMLYMLLEHES